MYKKIPKSHLLLCHYGALSVLYIDEAYALEQNI